jgi:hypothetical protein
MGFDGGYKMRVDIDITDAKSIDIEGYYAKTSEIRIDDVLLTVDLIVVEELLEKLTEIKDHLTTKNTKEIDR